MKSLAERHADRAQRKADSLAFSSNPKGDVGLAALRVGEAQAAIAALNPEQRDELKGLITGDGFSDADVDAYGDAYDARGSLKTAGIGVTNTLVAPVAFAAGNEQTAGPLGGVDGNGADTGASGWGDLPQPSITPADGNPDGAAVAAETGAQSQSEGEGGETAPKTAKTARKGTQGDGASE